MRSAVEEMAGINVGFHHMRTTGKSQTRHGAKARAKVLRHRGKGGAGA